MEDGRKIPYIIELGASDEKLRRQMSKWKWEEIIGTKGKGFGDILANEAEDAGKAIKGTLGGLNIDWSKILGTKEINQLEQAVTRALKNSKDQIVGLAAKGDTSGIENMITMVTTLGNELKGLGSNFDAAGLARGIGAFMKVLTPLAAKFEALSDEPKKVEVAFDRLFSGIATSAKSVDLGKTFDVSGKIKIAMQGLKATNEEILEATESLEKYRNMVAKLSGDNPATIKLAQDVAGLNQQLDEQMRKEEQLASQNKTNSAQYAATLKNIMAIENARLKLKEKPTKDYAGMEIREDFGYYEEQINKVVERISKKMTEVEEKLANTVDKSFAEIISKQISDIKLSVSLSEQAQAEFVNKINDFVQNVNKSPIEKVQIGVKPLLDDSANLIEDKQKRGYGQNEADDDVNTTKLITQTEKRFKGIRGAMYRNQNKILQQTKEWRQQMLEQFKFKSGDFEFNFNNNLVEELQSLFDEYGLKINIDPTYLADQIKTVLEGSSVSLGGGTANIDQASMTAAVIAGVRAALLGETLPITTMSTSEQEKIPDATEQTATNIEKSAQHLDIAEEYVKDVVQKLKDVAKYATKHLGTDKDTKGAIATREQFKTFGIDLEKVKSAGDDDAQIAQMLDPLLNRGDFNKLIGSTIVDKLYTFKGSSSNTISAFVRSLHEVFYMLQEDTETVDEWTRKKQSREIFDYARGRAIAADSLRNVRSSVRTDKIPDIEYIDKAISAMSAIGKNTDSLEALRLAREKLGDKTDEQSIREFNTVANDFYKSTTKAFYDIKKQAEDAFKGSVYLQGSKKGVIKKQDIENYKQLARIGDNDVILDIRIKSSLNNVALGTTKSKYSDRLSLREEERLMRGQRADYLVSPEYEKDILRKELTYGGFRSQGSPTSDINLDATLEANVKKREALMAEIKANEEEKKLLREQIDEANTQIINLTTKNNEIPQSRKDAALKKISEQEAKKTQLTTDIFWLEEQVGNGKNGDDKRVGKLTKQIEEQLEKRAFAERQLAELSEIDVERRKNSLTNKITEIEQNDLPKLQEELNKAQIKYNTSNSEKILAQIEVNKANSELKSIRKTKANAAIRSEAEVNVVKANRELARATEKFEDASRDVDGITIRIENNKRKIENLQSQISGTTLETIRQEQIARIEAINNVITSLENEFASKLAEKKAKETSLKRTNTTLDRARNDSALRTQRELDDATARRTNLIARDGELDKSSQDKQKEVSRLELLNQRVEAEKEYNALQEKSMVLQGSIKKMEEDGATEDALFNKKVELEKINAELAESLKKVQSLGGFIGQRESREYTDTQRKAYALDEIKKIDNDLIIARAQKNVVASRIAKKDKEIAEVDRWGLGAGIGARSLNQEKYQATSEFMNSDYVRSLIDTAREQTKNAIAEAVEKSELAETYALRTFNEKVANAMTKNGLNPHSTEQTQAFLKTTRGKQYSDDYNAEITSIQNSLQESTRELWSAYDERIKEIRSQASTEFKESMKVDNGVLSYVSKIKDESGEWIDEIVAVYVKDALRKRLIDAKKILEEDQAPIQGDIDRLYADRRTAIEYGGVSDKEILSTDIIENQIILETELNKRKEMRVELQQKINDLEQAGVADSDDSIKQERKKLTEIEKQIAQLEMLVRNRKKLVELRWDESKADSYTSEEKELHFTDQIVNYNQKIEASLAKQEELKRKIESASEEEKTNLQYQLSKEEDRVARWRNSISTTEGKLQKIETAKSAVATSEASSGIIVSLMKEALGNANVDLTPITEILNKILEILDTFKTDGIKMGGVKNTSEEKPKQTKKTEAELIRDNALKQHDVVRGLAAGRGNLYDQYMRDVEDLNKAVSEANAASEKDKKKAIAKVKTKAQKVSTLSYNILKNTSQWDYLVANSDSGAKNLHLKQGESLKAKMETMAKKEHGILGKRGGKLTNPKYQYDFLGFDGDTLTYQLTDIEGKTRKVTMVWNEFTKQVVMTSDKTGSKLSELAGKIESFGEKFKDAIDSGYLGAKDKDLKRFQDAVAKINTEIANGASFVTVDKLRNEALRVADEVTKKVAKNKRAYSGTTEINVVTRQRDNLSARNILDRTDIAMVEQYNKQYEELIKKHNQFKTNGTLFDPKNQQTLQGMAIKVRDLGKQLDKSITEAEQLEQLVHNSGTYRGQQMGGIKQLSPEEASNLEASMKSYLNTLGFANAEHIKYDHIHQRLTATQRISSHAVADLEMKYNKATGALYAYQKQERESLTGLPAFLNGFQKKFNSIMQYLTMTMSIHRVLSELRRGVQYVKEIDLALTELRKVTDETEETYDRFLQTAAKTGERLGATISAVTEATATFAKLGYSMAQATEMAEAAIVYKNVGDNIASTEDAADSIISTMKGFGLEATESMAIVDKFNEVGE